MESRNEAQGSNPFLLSVNVPDGAFTYFPLIRFDLSSLAGQTVTGDGTFSIFPTFTDPATRTVSLVNPPEAFNEATTTFNNYNPTADENDRIGTDIIPGTTKTFSTPASEYLNFTLPQALLQSWIDSPASNLGLGVYQAPAPSNDVNFASRENADASKRPLLSFDAVPEPTSAVLLGAALLVTACRRLRRHAV